MMKRVVLALTLAAALSAAFPAHAQSPVIYGVAQSNGQMPQAYTYWSVYGQNLSTITSTSCSGQGSSISWSFPIADNDGDVTIFSQNNMTGCNDPSYWYENGGQINFYANVFVPPNDGAFNSFHVVDPATTYGQTLGVCNSLGLCAYGFHYN